MKSLFVLLVVIMCSTACVAYDSPMRQQGISLSSLEEIYRRDQPVTLIIKNYKDKSTSVYSNVEVMNESGEWVTWPFRLEDGRVNAISIIYKIAPGESKTLVFDVNNVVLPPVPEGGKAKLANELSFRFRIITLNQGVRSEQFSSPFVIEDPYGSGG